MTRWGHSHAARSLPRAGPTTPATVQQTPGARHDQRHKDGSQRLVLVAGHCLVMGPDDTDYSWRTTESVYLSKDLGDLVHAFEVNPGVARYPTTPR